MKNKINNYIAWLILLIIAIYFGYNKLRRNNQAPLNPFVAYKNGKQVGGTVPGSETLITIDNQALGYDSLPRDVQFELFKEEQNFHEKQNIILKNFAVRFHAAKEKNPDTSSRSTPALTSFLNTNISEKDIDQLFEKEKAKYPANTSVFEIRNQIKFNLISENYLKFYLSNLTELYSRKKMKMNLSFSMIPEEWLEFNDFPKLGSSSAKNKLIVIANYTCETCKQLHIDLGNLYTKMGQDHLEITFIPYDSPGRPNDLLNRVAMCVLVQSQELFWKFHVAVINDPNKKNAIDLSEISARYLKDLKVNSQAFNSCMADKTSKLQKAFSITRNKLSFLNIPEVPVLILNGKKLDTEGRKPLSAIEENLINE